MQQIIKTQIFYYLGFGLMEVLTKIFKSKNNDILDVTSSCHHINNILTYIFSSKIYYIMYVFFSNELKFVLTKRIHLMYK